MPLRLLAAAALTLALAGPALAAELVRVETKAGETIEAEQAFPTYTTLVLMVPGPGLRLLPNEQVARINGVPYEQAYWADQALVSEGAASNVATPAAAPAELLPLEAGTRREYALTGERTTWVRLGRTMKRHAPERVEGLARVTVVGVAPEGPVVVRESVIERTGGGPAREVQSLQLLERRDDGYFLVGYGLGAEPADTTINVPPQLWPRSLSEGQTWVVGPFKRLGAYQVARMQVVGREAVSVPAGAFPDAYKVVGFGHVFAGANNLSAGRVMTDNGTVETTTWVVPGIGPVKEERKVHLHQDFFPARQSGDGTPFVVEEITTRELTTHQAGARP